MMLGENVFQFRMPSRFESNGDCGEERLVDCLEQTADQSILKDAPIMWGHGRSAKQL
jgi:hypothetical protein